MWFYGRLPMTNKSKEILVRHWLSWVFISFIFYCLIFTSFFGGDVPSNCTLFPVARLFLIFVLLPNLVCFVCSYSFAALSRLFFHSFRFHSLTLTECSLLFMCFLFYPVIFTALFTSALTFVLLFFFENSFGQNYLTSFSSFHIFLPFYIYFQH